MAAGVVVLMANTYVRVGGTWRIAGNYVEPTDPDPDPGGGGNPPPPSPDRPALSSPPNASSTGPRVTITGTTLNSSQAISAAQANGGILIGRRISSLRLDSPSHGDLVFQDCEFGGSPGGGSTYIVNCWFSQLPRPTDGARAIFDHCRMTGGSSSTVVGYDMRLLHCDISGGIDCVKPFGNNEIYASWLHDTWHSSGAHCDTIQVQNGSNFLIHWCGIDAFNHPGSPSNAGLPNSGGLQTGKTLGSLTNWRMNDNWVDGGGYTLRGPDNPDGHTMDMVFRRNKHGRNFSVGAITRMGEAGADYDSSNVWQDNGQPVLGG